MNEVPLRPKSDLDCPYCHNKQTSFLFNGGRITVGEGNIIICRGCGAHYALPPGRYKG